MWVKGKVGVRGATGGKTEAVVILEGQTLFFSKLILRNPSSTVSFFLLYQANRSGSIGGRRFGIFCHGQLLVVFTRIVGNASHRGFATLINGCDIIYNTWFEMAVALIVYINMIPVCGKKLHAGHCAVCRVMKVRNN